MADTSAFVPVRYLAPWPEDLFRFSDSDDGPTMIDRIGLTSFDFDDSTPGKTILRAGIALLDEVSLEIPGLSGFSVVFGAPRSSSAAGAEFIFEADLDGSVSFRLKEIDLVLRMQQDLIHPAVRDADGKWVVDKAPDGTTRPFEIQLAGVSLSVDTAGNIDLSFAGGAPGLAIDPFTIGDSGIVVEADQPVHLYLSRAGPVPPGRPQGWRGVHIPHAAVHLPHVEFPAAPSGLEFVDCSIGSGGFSGELDVPWPPGAASGSLLGAKLDLSHLKMKFVQNTPVLMDIEGQLTLPFFDQPLRVNLGIGVDGSLAVTLSAVQPPGVTSRSGLVTFKKTGLLELTVESLGFDVGHGVLTTKLSGELTPLFRKDEGLDWPSFKVKELAIDSRGNVRLEGGWLDLPDQYHLDFYGFQMEITKLGFGKTKDGGKWIGFSGAVKLVEGFPAGASVEGLRITWYEDQTDKITDIKITFNGVGVEFEVPEVLSFKGAVSYRELPGDVHRFDGAIKLNLESLQMEVDGTLVFGSARADGRSYNFFAIYLGVELPAGIPLWSTGIALYGMAGLFALQMMPNKKPTEGWYENPDGAKGWYKRDTEGVTDLKAKWDPKPDSLALGVGATLGTLPDNGTSFHGKFLLVLVFPGPILLLEGRGDLLKERAKLDDKPENEPLFRALGVLDSRAGNFLVGLDAKYKQAGQGELIDIGGSAQAFFDFHNADAWHVYLGEKEPREKRIHAQAFKFFEANAYLMLDAHRLAMGAWYGYNRNWKFGPLKVALEAWIEGNAALNFKPPQFHGDLWVHGKAELGAYKYHVGVMVDARIAADAFRPYHLLGQFNAEIKLPSPLPNPHATVKLEWGPEPTRPPLPLPLKEVAVEHLKVKTSWPLPRDKDHPLLVPNYDKGDGFLDEQAPVVSDENAPVPSLDQIPVVPVDSRPHLTFGRHVNDDALVGVSSTTEIWERIGDPAKNEGPVRVRYGLKEVSLYRRDSQDTSKWERVAWASKSDPNSDPKTKLYGSWAPVPPPPESISPQGVPQGADVSPGQTKLWLWSKTPFDYTHHSSRAWDEWFTNHLRQYPCVATSVEREVCCDFQGVATGTEFRPGDSFPNSSEIFLYELYTDDFWHARVHELSEPVGRFTNALQISGGHPELRSAPAAVVEVPPLWITIGLNNPARAVSILLTKTTNVVAVGFSEDSQLYGPFASDPSEPNLIKITGQNLVRVRLEFPPGAGLDYPVYIVQICAQQTDVLNRHLRAELARWSQEDYVLEPNTTYRLKVVTTIKEEGQFSNDYTRAEFAYFRTEGPPGLTELSTPIGGTNTPVYESGTVSVSNGSPTVTGADTSWSSDLVGSDFQVKDDPTTYKIASVVPSNQLVLRRPYIGPNKSGATYSISRFDSGLGDLIRYVEQTIPATVPAPGEKPPLPRPVYRGYDVGAKFNENYVELMYRLARRDLGLYLYDNNNRPVRDAQGRLIVLSNRWGQAEETTLDEGEERWLYLLERSGCVPAAPKPEEVRSDMTLVSADEGQVLDADTLYEARFVPLLLHEDFSEDQTGWRAIGGSDWKRAGHKTLEGVKATVAEQKVSLADSPDLSVLLDPQKFGEYIELKEAEKARPFGRYRITSFDNADKTVTVDRTPELSSTPSKWQIPGLGAVSATSASETTLVRGESGWSDYRLSAYLRPAGDKPIGLVFRHSDDNNYYRFSIDLQNGQRQLGKVVGGTPSEPLKKPDGQPIEDNFAFRKDQDYLITVEAIGPELRIYQDGALVFETTDTDRPILMGGLGLYSAGNTDARFSDVRVDDFSPGAPVAYRFDFITSQFTNFFHHLHSFQDETWLKDLTAAEAMDAEIAAFVAAAVPPANDDPSENETRAYETFAKKVVGEAATHQEPSEVEVTRVERNGAPLAFLVRSPEPIDWKRTDLEVLWADRPSPSPTLPGPLKLTDVAFGGTGSGKDSVTLLLREAMELTGQRIEYRGFNNPVVDDTFDKALNETFDDLGPGPGHLLPDGPPQSTRAIKRSLLIGR